jgi:hypothetical protein
MIFSGLLMTGGNIEFLVFEFCRVGRLMSGIGHYKDEGREMSEI